MLKELLRNRVGDALGESHIEIRLDVPTHAEFGDFSTNVALALAKQSGRSPREIALDLASKIELGAEIERVEVAGPGFVNFYLKPEYVTSLLPTVLEEGFGRGQIEKPEKINVEFISANPTGPLTLGNGRGGFVGDVVVGTLRFLGQEVESEYYFNDAGTQIQRLVRSVRAAKKISEPLPEELQPGEPFSYDPEYKGPYINELASELQGDMDTLSDNELGEKLTQLIFERYIRGSIARMGIEFSEWFNEKNLIASGATARAFERLKTQGLLAERDGAVWLISTKLGDERDRVLQKSNGDVTYLGNDIAYHLNILEERRFDRAIKIWGADHAGQIPSLRLTMHKLLPEKRLDFVVVQWVRLIRSGQEFTMSKRAGTYVTVDDLLELIGGDRPADVARWFFISRSHDTHMDFDLDLARERSEKNPVYYVQYAHARIAGILRQAGSQQGVASSQEDPDWSVLVKPEETALIKRLLDFPEVIKEAGTGPGYPVHKLAFYAQDVATAFHKFYHEHRVLEAEEPLRSARLRLIQATQITLRKLLVDLIGVDAPDKM